MSLPGGVLLCPSEITPNKIGLLQERTSPGLVWAFPDCCKSIMSYHSTLRDPMQFKFACECKSTEHITSHQSSYLELDIIGSRERDYAREWIRDWTGFAESEEVSIEFNVPED